LIETVPAQRRRPTRKKRPKRIYILLITPWSVSEGRCEVNTSKGVTGNDEDIIYF
jgi:hypothetical protein